MDTPIWHTLFDPLDPTKELPASPGFALKQHIQTTEYTYHQRMNEEKLAKNMAIRSDFDFICLGFRV